MIRAAIVGATGYAGAELVRLLTAHPAVELNALTSRTYTGEFYESVYPHLTGQVGQTCREQDINQVVAGADVLFLALPHGLSVPWVVAAYQAGKKVIDLGADFRFRRRDIYEKWYKVEHTAPELLAVAVYGLPELYREKIRGAAIIGNPGCYPTASVLGLAPLLGQGLIDENRLIIDAKSGVSGAGRGLALGAHYSEVNENVKAYNIAKHRHTPEIEQELAAMAGVPAGTLKISFSPHLIPMTRGILATAYADLRDGVTIEEEVLREKYREFYAGEPFVKITGADVWPQTKWCYGSNYVFIGLTVDLRTRRVVVTTAIDNLVKGAAGQAVQNMNIICGFPETTGLTGPGIWP
ncbi:MAG: N-acetyl-gamma-glutamyl-phosphate reductase [Heliobacteriaceae bacterium]|nr:N-acetyl-gamma-glutamyl-phosphate reductase [Heliobacteriaceae bacterium]MDD4587785.1 N-acetyl-gamma-glutamyl-phosphate reductase [Heliobacteriaceae bacterium]